MRKTSFCGCLSPISTCERISTSPNSTYHRGFHMLLLVGLLVLCYPIQAMTADAPIELPPLVIDNLLNESIDVAGVPFRYTGAATISFDFSDGPQARPIVQIKGLVEFDLEGFRIAFPEAVYRQARSTSYTEEVTPHSPNVQPQGNGTVVATERIKYEKFHLSNTYCPTWSKPLRTCPKRGLKVAQKTVVISVTLTPTIDKDNNLRIAASSVLDDRGGIPNALLNLVGLMTFNIGSKFLSDTYRSQLSEIRAKLPEEIKALDLEEASEIQLNLNAQNAKFINGESGKLVLQIAYTSDRTYKPRTARFLRNKIVRRFGIKEKKTAVQLAEERTLEIGKESTSFLSVLGDRAKEMSSIIEAKGTKASGVKCVRAPEERSEFCYGETDSNVIAFDPNTRFPALPVKEEDKFLAEILYSSYEFNRHEFLKLISEQRVIMGFLSLPSQSAAQARMEFQLESLSTYDSQMGLFENYVRGRENWARLTENTNFPMKLDILPKSPDPMNVIKGARTFESYMDLGRLETPGSLGNLENKEKLAQ